MQYEKKSVFVLTYHPFLCQHIFGKIRLPAVIASNMVLQQQSTVTLWGWADPGEKIIITTSWNNAVDSVVTTGDAKWKIKINTPAAGGPYTITLKGWTTVVLGKYHDR